jgi:hypothetical protein
MAARGSAQLPCEDNVDMDERTARAVVDRWSGGAGVVPRGPMSLLSVVPATPSDVEKHTGRRPYGTEFGGELWRLEVSGRFLASSGVVYPSGVPFPEELHNQTAIIANEVWLYSDDDGMVVGAYWWPDAVRRPIASVPRSEYLEDDALHPDDARRAVDVPVVVPDGWDDAVAVRLSRREVIVFCAKDACFDPLNEMLIYEKGGISVRTRAEDERPDITSFLRSHQPPYRRLQVRYATGVGRDAGRALGPQTWPWPGELRWWEKGVAYELRGFCQLTALVDVATALP